MVVDTQVLQMQFKPNLSYQQEENWGKDKWHTLKWHFLSYQWKVSLSNRQHTPLGEYCLGLWQPLRHSDPSVATKRLLPHALAWGNQCLDATVGRNTNLWHILGMFKKHIWLLIAAEPFGTPTFPVFYGLPTLTGEQVFKLTAYGQEMGFKMSFILYLSIPRMLWASTLNTSFHDHTTRRTGAVVYLWLKKSPLKTREGVAQIYVCKRHLISCIKIHRCLPSTPLHLSPVKR